MMVKSSNTDEYFNKAVDTMKIFEFPNGLTVRELKTIIENWLEMDDDGELTEVWIETSRYLSNPVTMVSPLNQCDIILCSSRGK